MSLSTADRQELIALLHDLCNGHDIDNRAAWLHKTVIEEPEARQIYVDTVWLTGGLRWLLKGSPASPMAPADAQSISVSSDGREGTSTSTKPALSGFLADSLSHVPWLTSPKILR